MGNIFYYSRRCKCFEIDSYTHSFLRFLRPFKFSILLILFLWRYKWVNWVACSKFSIFVKQLFCKYITVKFLQCEISPWKCKTTRKYIYSSTALLWLWKKTMTSKWTALTIVSMKLPCRWRCVNFLRISVSFSSLDFFRVLRVTSADVSFTMFL
jgi:hypothetical protein